MRFEEIMNDVQPDTAVQPPVSLRGVNPQSESAPAGPNRFATAGKRGAERVHQLIRFGHQYEKEHGLKRGRQRIRQLIQLGRRFEVEHGLAAPARRKRKSKADAWAEFVKALARVVKPAYRKDVERLVAKLAEPQPAPAGDATPAAA
jgi:hypothetical protein